jgi:CDGSH-type Zn-finger protein/uncharacterized Fe-S cluster protein YjdI
MTDRLKHYSGKGIEVTYHLRRCTHADECVRGLPAVFDTARRPWVQPENAGVDEIAAVVLRCPTGALHFTREDGGPGEPLPERNTVQVVPDGPLYVRGQVTIVSPEGELILEDTRVALCRCGASENKPFCDNSHRTAGFRDDGRLPAISNPGAENHGPLKIVLEHNGPLKLQGKFELLSAGGLEQYSGRRSVLCRCGCSQRKPFCDGNHSRADFLTVISNL